MMSNKKFAGLLFLLSSIAVLAFSALAANKNEAEKKNENDWVIETCEGVVEYRLADKTRVDCLTDNQAIEYDWQNKWAEGIGQALFYGAQTGLTPTLRLICKNKNCPRYIKRVRAVVDYYQLPLVLEIVN